MACVAAQAGPAPEASRDAGDLNTAVASRNLGPVVGWRPAPTNAGESFIESRELAALAAHIAEEKKGVDVRVYDVSEHIRIASFFVLVTGLSRPHVQAIASAIQTRLKELGEHRPRPEGADLGWWLLLDYVDVVVHVLQPEARQHYALDQLYAQCPVLDVASVAPPGSIVPPAARAAQ
jgi:ribosome-associated protein